MICTTTKVGEVTMFTCSRGSRRSCSAPGCIERESRLCDWRLHRVVDGKRVYSGKLCSKPLCVGHAVRVGEKKDLCPAHHKKAKEMGFVK